MEIELNELKEIAIEYFDIDNEDIFKNNYDQFIIGYNYIKNCNCVKGRNAESLIDCLYFIASDIASNEFFKTTTDCYGNEFDNYQEKHKSLEYIVSDALYRIYDEDAIPNLSEQYVYIKKLKR